MKRRSFMAAMLAACAAPYVAAGAVQRGVWMPVRAPIWVPPKLPGLVLVDAAGLVLCRAELTEAGPASQGLPTHLVGRGVVDGTGYAAWAIVTHPDGTVIEMPVNDWKTEGSMKMDTTALTPGMFIQTDIHVNTRRFL